MAFDIRNLSEVRALGSSRWDWYYFTGDTLATVLAPDYFSTVNGLSRLHVGDLLSIVASSGAESATVAISSLAGGSVVTSAPTVPASAVVRADGQTAQQVFDTLGSGGGGATTAAAVTTSAVPAQSTVEGALGALQTSYTGEAATRAAADLLLAPLASPALTGTPTVPTAAASTNTTQAASTAFATGAVATEATARAAGDATNVTAIGLKQDATPSASVNFNSQKGINLATPTASSDAVTKAYVDALAQGLSAKGSCVASTTANITLSGAQTIDGVSVVAGNRVLAKNQTSSLQNGIYVAAAGAWARATDMDTWAETQGAYTLVTGGTANVNTGWVSQTVAGGTLETTAITFAQFNSASAVASVLGRTGAVVAQTGDYTVAQVTGAAPIASPTFTGTPAGPTAAAATNTTQLATTAFATGAVATEATARSTADALLAPLASPTLTGTPAAPTATTGDSSTKLATTAFVAATVAATVVSPQATATQAGAPATALTATQAQIGTTVTITPRSTSSKVLIVARLDLTKDATTTARTATARLWRGAVTSGVQVGQDAVLTSTVLSGVSPAVIVGIDSPATTAAVSYRLSAAGGVTTTWTASRYEIQAIELLWGGFDPLLQPVDYPFATRAAAALATVPAAFQRMAISGWTAAGDGGNNGYYRVAADPGHTAALRTADRFLPNGSTDATNGGWWNIDTPSRLEQFGDNSDAYATALTRLESFLTAEAVYTGNTISGGRQVSITLPSVSVIRIPRPLLFPILLRDLAAGSARTQLMPGVGSISSTFGSNPAVRVNVDGSGNWVDQFPGMRTGKIGSLCWLNDQSIDWRCLEVGGPYRVERQFGNNVNQLISFAGGYSDQVICEGVTNVAPRAAPGGWTEQQYAVIASPGIGDASEFNNIQSSGSGATEEHIASYVRGCRGGINRNSINGRHHVYGSDGYVFLNGHYETGGLKLEESNVSVRDNVFLRYTATASPPIATVNSNSGNGDVYKVVAENNSFVGAGLYQGYTPAAINADVDIAAGYRFISRNNRRSYSEAGGTGQRSEMGILISQATVLDTTWRSISPVASVAGRVEIDGIVRVDNAVASVAAVTGFFLPIDNNGPSGTSVWDKATATYYYIVLHLFDTKRMLGYKNSHAEVSIAKTLGGAMILHIMGSVPMSTYRFCRGTTAGTYTQKCDVPMISPGYPLDIGTHINGFIYETFNTGDNVPAIANFLGWVRFVGANVEVHCTDIVTSAGSIITAPAAGVWTQGDIIYFDNMPVDGTTKRCRGIQKITTGSGNVAGTDWIAFY